MLLKHKLSVFTDEGKSKRDGSKEFINNVHWDESEMVQSTKTLVRDVLSSRLDLNKK